MSNNKDNAWRFGPESTIGAAVTDPLQQIFGTTLKPSGGSGPKRTATTGVTPDQQPRDNVPEFADASLSMAAPSVYSHLAPLRAAICGQPSVYSGGLIVPYSAGFTTTASDITAAATGDQLEKVAGSWAAFPPGAIVKVVGFAGGAGKNPATFLAKVKAVSGQNLQFYWPVLLDETPAGPVTVTYDRHLRIGTTLQTFYFEMFNAIAGYGNTYQRVGVKSWKYSVDIKTAECTESFDFTCGAEPNKIGVIGINDTIPVPDVHVHNSNTDFGAKLLAGFGGMFRYNGLELSPGNGSGQIRINKVDHAMTRNVSSSGGVGEFGPLSVFTDGMLDVMLTLEVMRDSAQAEQMIADRKDKTFVADIGFCLYDGTHTLYREYPALQFDAGDDSQGMAQAGEDYITFPLKAKRDPLTGTLFQETLLG